VAECATEIIQKKFPGGENSPVSIQSIAGLLFFLVILCGADISPALIPIVGYGLHVSAWSFKLTQKKDVKMGTTHVTVLVRNPANPDKTWEGLFLVDTVAVDSLVPGRYLKEIGLSPKSKRTYELADGTEVKLDITTGKLEFMGDIVGSTIIFGADDAEPILGVTALESVGIEVDPRNQLLKRLPAARLK
jgi:clan AA aspartic protease